MVLGVLEYSDLLLPSRAAGNLTRIFVGKRVCLCRHASEYVRNTSQLNYGNYHFDACANPPHLQGAPRPAFTLEKVKKKFRACNVQNCGNLRTCIIIKEQPGVLKFAQPSCEVVGRVQLVGITKTRQTSTSKPSLNVKQYSGLIMSLIRSIITLDINT